MPCSSFGRPFEKARGRPPASSATALVKNMYDLIIGRGEAERKKLGTAGTILLGKHYVKMGQTTSLSNRIYMDVAGSHVVLICGKRGCLSGETLVFTDSGYKKIRAFDDQKDRILSFDTRKKSFEWESGAKLISYPLEDEELVEIELRDGGILQLTEEHPLLVYKKKKLSWQIAANIDRGDRLASIRALPARTGKGKLTNFNEGLVYRNIKTIQRVKGIKRVYDLRVKKNHSFIANGIISHNSGKSYSQGVIAEGMADLPPEVKDNIAVVMLDTMGIYWTMKYPNRKDDQLLKEWDLEARGLDVHVYTPKGFFKQYKEQDIPTDFPFSIKPTELDASDWCLSFEIALSSELGVVIERVITDLKEEGKDYDIDGIIARIRQEEDIRPEVREGVINRFLSAKSWGLFDTEGTPISDLVKGGQVTVLDVSCYATIPGASNVKALVIGLVSERLFLDRMLARKQEERESIQQDVNFVQPDLEEKKEPLVWLILDEAHEFLPNQGETVATRPLVTILREGRQPGISLILATQQPGKIHGDVMTQSDVVIAHRVTANFDIQALGTLMQSYMREGLDKQLNDLPRVQGAAIVFDDSNEKMYPMRVRPRISWHGGGSPSALKMEKELFDF